MNAGVGGRPGVGFAESQREIVRSPWAEPVDRADRGDEPLEADAAIEADDVVGDGTREGANSECSRARESESVEVGAGECLGYREGVGEPEWSQSGNRAAVPLNQPSGDRVCGGERDPLADDRAHTGLEGIPCSRRAQTRSRPDERAEGGIHGQRASSLVEIEVEVWDTPRPLYDVHELFPVREMRAQNEVITGAGKELEDAGVAADDDRPPVGVRLDVFDAGNCLRGEVGRSRLPVEQTSTRQPEGEAAVGS